MAEPKKQIPLRLNAKLYDALAAWAEDDFRSVNGQIEYLLTECVRQRKKNGKYVSDQIDMRPNWISSKRTTLSVKACWLCQLPRRGSLSLAWDKGSIASPFGRGGIAKQ